MRALVCVDTGPPPNQLSAHCLRRQQRTARSLKHRIHLRTQKRNLDLMRSLTRTGPEKGFEKRKPNNGNLKEGLEFWGKGETDCKGWDYSKEQERVDLGREER